MSKPPSRIAGSAKGAEQPEAKDKQPSRLVRYPNSSSALRSLLAEGGVKSVTTTLLPAAKGPLNITPATMSMLGIQPTMTTMLAAKPFTPSLLNIKPTTTGMLGVKPLTINALVLKGLTPPTIPVLTDLRPSAKPSPSETSRPSPAALLLLDGGRSVAPERHPDVRTGDRSASPSSSSVPRMAPVDVFDSAALGDVIRIRRHMLRLSQKALADRAGVGRRLIGEMEAGKASVELGKALMVCRALDLTLSVAVSDAD